MNQINSQNSRLDQRTFLFLQGPISPFFPEIADQLRKKGHICLRINLCFGDWLFWRRAGVTNYRKKKDDWPDFIEKFLIDQKVTDILLLGEQRFYHKRAIESAKKLGINIVVTDFGYIRPDWITFEKEGMSGDSLFPKDPEVIRQLAQNSPQLDKTVKYRDSFRNMAIMDIAYHVSSTLFHVLYPGYRTHQLHHPILVYIGTGLRLVKNKWENKKADQRIQELIDQKADYFVFPLQMATDFSVRAYSNYNTLDDAIEETLSSFAQNTQSPTRLVLKIHPLDPGLMDWGKRIVKMARKYDVLDRIDYLQGGNLQTLLKHSKGVVTINSTVGIWALGEHCPVKILGKAVYDIEGLVHQESLASFWKNPFVPDQDLCADFFKSMAATVQIRGVYYNRPGLDMAVKEAVDRLVNHQVNAIHVA